MKICFLGGTRYSQPLDKTAEKKFQALKSLGEVFVIGFSRDVRLRSFSEHAHFYLLPKFSLPFLRYIEMFTLGPLIALWLVLRHRIQILVAQSPYEGAAAAIVKKIAQWFGRRVALVVESHGDFEEGLFLQRRIYLPTLYRFLMRHAARYALRQADLLRAVSDSTRKQLEQWAPARPIFQFTTWTDIEVFCAVGGGSERKSCQDILYAGVLIPRKGVHHLVRAFAHIAPAFSGGRLIIMGGEENKHYAAELKALVKQAGLHGKVHFGGEVPQAELAQWMRQARVFVLPAYSEGLPRVVIEAMAAGLPVIATAVSGIPDVIEEGVTGFLIPPGDEASLAQRLRWVFEHPEKAQKIGSQARAFVQGFFSTEVYVHGYKRILEAAEPLLAEKTGRAYPSL